VEQGFECINFNFPFFFQEFHWFAKLCHMWDDVVKLKREMSKVINGGTTSGQKSNSSTFTQCGTPIAFRIKVLQAVATLQSHLSGLDNELGSAFWHPFIDHVICVKFSYLIIHDRILFTFLRVPLPMGLLFSLLFVTCVSPKVLLA